ncbi:MAG TPA: hypothetical protein VI759_06715 [Dehalococcoidia bacterium]|nr:hypothetical protein [Dehalococcoidia bacterium]
MKFKRQGGLKAGILAMTLGLLAVFFGVVKSEPGISAGSEPTPTLTATPTTQPTTSNSRIPQRQATPTQGQTTPPQATPAMRQAHTRTRAS